MTPSSQGDVVVGSANALISIAFLSDVQREIRVLNQAIQRAEQESYTYLVAHLKERLRLIQVETSGYESFFQEQE